MKQLTLDCRIVLVNKVRLNQLDREAGFSNTTSSNNDKLVFPKELRCTLFVILTSAGLVHEEMRERGRGREREEDECEDMMIAIVSGYCGGVSPPQLPRLL